MNIFKMAGILLFTRIFAISVWVEANGIEPLAIFYIVFSLFQNSEPKAGNQRQVVAIAALIFVTIIRTTGTETAVKWFIL